MHREMLTSAFRGDDLNKIVDRDIFSPFLSSIGPTDWKEEQRERGKQKTSATDDINNSILQKENKQVPFSKRNQMTSQRSN